MIKQIRGNSRVRILGCIKAVAFGCGLLLALPVAAAFTQLESIKADGNVWIYSGYKPKCTDRVEVSFRATSTSTAALYCARGKGTTTDTFTAFIIGSLRLDRNTTTSGPSVAFTLNEDHTLVVDGSTLKATLDGNPVAGDLASGTFTPGSAFSLFASHTQGVDLSASTAKSSMSNFGTHTLYSFKVYSESGELVADFVPARDDEAAAGTTAQYGLFDRVNHTFRKGLGTGTFTVGAQVGETGGLGRGSMTCTWIAGASGKWSDSANWVNGVAPQVGYLDTLTFDLSGGDIDCENDLEGLVISRLVMINGTADTSFTLRGKGLTIRDGLRSDTDASWVGSGKVFCYVPLTFTSDAATLVSKTGSLTFYGGLTLTGAYCYFRGDKTLYFYDNPVVGPNTTFESGGHNVPCHFYVPLRVKAVNCGFNGCNGNIFLFATGNEWENIVVKYYGTFCAGVANALPTNTVFKWNQDYTFDGSGNWTYELRGNQTADRIHMPSPYLNADKTAILSGVQIKATSGSHTLTLRGTTNAVAHCKLVNDLSIVWDPIGDWSQTFAERAHPTTGTLTVKGGALISAGTNTFGSVTCLTVHDGASFAVTDSADNSAVNPFTGSTDLLLHGTGVVDVPAGVTVTFQNALVKGRLMDAKTYQALDGTDANAEKVDWVHGAGLVQVTAQTGTSWINAAGGDWADPANWSNGTPDAHPSDPVYVALEGAPYVVDFGTTNAWPKTLTLDGAAATVRIPSGVSVDYDGSGKTSKLVIQDGATLLVDGGTLNLTNFNGTIQASSAVAAVTSRLDVAAGVFRLAAANNASRLNLSTGGELCPRGGSTIIMMQAGDAKAILLKGGCVRADGTGTLYLGVPSGSTVWYFYEGSYLFAGSSSVTKIGGENSYTFTPDGVTCEMTFTENACLNFGSGVGALYMTSKNGGKSTLNLNSVANHTLPYRTFIANGGGEAELNMDRGYLKIGQRGLDLGTSSATNNCPTRDMKGVFNLSGGDVACTVDDLYGWGCAQRIIGINIGYGAYTGLRSGDAHPYVGELNQTGGAITNESALTTIGTGYGKGTWRMSGGLYKTKKTTNQRNHFIGTAGGIGLLDMSGGTYSIASTLYVGGAFTNAMFRCESMVANGWPINRHDADGTVRFSGGAFSVGQALVLGADGRGTIERIGTNGTFTVTGDLVLSNTVENAASGGTLKFVYDADGGIAPLMVGGKLVITSGAKVVVDLGTYGTQKGAKSKRYLVKPTGGVVGDWASVSVEFMGDRAKVASVNADERGLYAQLSSGTMLLFR